MAPAIPTVEPKQILAGATVQWTKSLSDFPAATWTLAYTFVGSVVKLNLTATVSGSLHLLTITQVQSATMNLGATTLPYFWQSYASSGTERYKVGEGNIDVLADLADASVGYDGRSYVKKTLDALDAIILGKASKDQKMALVGDRQIQRMSPAELLQWRSFYQAEYKAELAALAIANGEPAGNKVLVSFR